MKSGKSGSIRQSCCIREKVVVFDQNGCNWGKVVVFGQKLLCSGRSGCFRAKSYYSCINSFNPGNWLYLGKSGRIRAKWLYSGKIGCIRAKWL